MERRYTAFRYTAYALELLLLFILQTTPRLFPEIFGSKTLFLMPAALTISFLESEIPALFFGMAGGIMLDLGYSDNIGFFAFTLTVSCFFISLIFRDYFVVSFLNATAFTAIFSAGLIVIYYLFFHVFAGKGNSLFYFFEHYFSRITLTIIVGILLYYLNKFLFRSLRDH